MINSITIEGGQLLIEQIGKGVQTWMQPVLAIVMVGCIGMALWFRSRNNRKVRD